MEIHKRQMLSCTTCRIRKCDRVQPCQACCTSGQPSTCVYVINSKERLEPIRQSYEIRKLRAELDELKALTMGSQSATNIESAFEHDAVQNDELDQPIIGPSLPNSSQHGKAIALPNKRQLALHKVISAIAAGSDDVINEIVRQIRTGINPEDIMASLERGRGSLLKPIRRPHTEGREHIRRSGRELVQRSHLQPQPNDGGTGSFSIPREPQRHDIYQDAFMERFLSNFAPELPSQMMTARPQNFSPWLLALAHARASSPILTVVSQCIATGYAAKVTKEFQLSLESQKMYAKALVMLQKALYSEESGSVETLGTVLSLTLYEFINYTAPTSWLDHIRGAEQLFEFRGSHQATSGTAHDMFLFFRPYGIISAFRQGRPNFLSRPEWKTVPWSLNPSSKTVLDHLLDHVADIPILLSEFEELSLGRLSSPIEYSRRAAFCRSVADMEYRLRNWKVLWADSYVHGQPFEVPQREPDGPRHHWWTRSGEDFQLPPFVCGNGPNTAAASNIYYPDIFLAQALNIYYVSLLQLARIDMRPDCISELEVYDLACLISRSAAYYLSAPGCSGVIASMWPLRMAHFSFPEESTERDWLERLFERIANNASLDISKRTRPDIPLGVTDGRTVLDTRHTG